LLLPALGGLLLSFSRAGIALGLVAFVATALGALSGRPLHRAAAIALLVAIAAVPLADLGADRLAARYATSGADLGASGGRAPVWLGTLATARAFPLTGCGLGAFTWSFPSSPIRRCGCTTPTPTTTSCSSAPRGGSAPGSSSASSSPRSPERPR